MFNVISYLGISPSGGINMLHQENKSQQTDDDEPFSLLNQDDDLIKNLSTLLDT